MRAWLLDKTTGPEAYRLGEVPTPEPGTGEVRVALRASALNHLDLWVARGMPAPPSFAHIPGADGAGVIDAVGPGVTRAEIGEEVVIDPSTSCGTCAACARGDIPFCPDFRVVGEHRPGTHADAIVLPEANVARKPARLDWPEAAAFGLVASSAWRMLRRAQVEEGDRVLVVGVGGGTSTAAFLLARALGAEVFVTSSAPEKRGWAMERGAAGAFHSAGPYDEEVHAATDGRGVDVVFDNVGTVTFERSLRALARGRAARHERLHEWPHRRAASAHAVLAPARGDRLVDERPPGVRRRGSDGGRRHPRHPGGRRDPVRGLPTRPRTARNRRPARQAGAGALSAGTGCVIANVPRAVTRRPPRGMNQMTDPHREATERKAPCRTSAPTASS